MSLLKEIDSPLKKEDIVFNGGVGEGHLKHSKKPFWKKKRFIIGIPLLIIIAMGFAGYQIAVNYASQKVVKEISTQIPTSEIKGLLKDPSIQKLIETEVGTEKQQEILKKYAVEQNHSKATPNTNKSTNIQKENPTNNIGTQKTAETEKPANPPVVQKPNSDLVFKTRQDVLKFLLSKFTMDELTGLSSQAQGGLTDEEKAKVKQKVLSRLSDSEYQALKVFAVIELSKGNQ